MPYAYFYGRVSHLDSANKKEHKFAATCVSIDVQLEMAKRRFEYDLDTGHPDLHWGRVGWTGTRRDGQPDASGAFIDQVVSAYKIDWPKRPAGSRLFAALKEGDTVYTAYLDRMFRRNRDQANTLADFDKRGIRLVFINENLDSTNEYHRFTIQMMSCVSELNSTIIGRRTKEALAHKRANGKRMNGKMPRGYKVGPNNSVIPDDEVRRMKLRIVELRDVQKLTWVQASDLLEDERVAAGAQWLPDLAGDLLEARPWTAKRLQFLYHDKAVKLPSEMLPPGTFDAPPGTLHPSQRGPS